MTQAAVQPVEIRSAVAPDIALTAQRIVELRSATQPLGWAQVRTSLNLNDRELSRFRWLIGAELFAHGSGWTEISQHPACGWGFDTLRKRHGQAKLPGGLSWHSYVEAYRTALKQRLAELQESQGRNDAELIHQTGQVLRRNVHTLALAVEDYIAHPPASVSYYGKHVPATEDHVQQVIAFPGVSTAGLPTETAGKPKKRLTTPFIETMLGLNKQAIEQLEKVQRVLVGRAPEDSAGQEPEMEAYDPAELEQRRARLEQMNAELLALRNREDASA
jgi:hypothetical protein